MKRISLGKCFSPDFRTGLAFCYDDNATPCDNLLNENRPPYIHNLHIYNQQNRNT